ncbi:hypothetical protein Aglo01_41440 [Actinokineospora globicatena]|nr:hypothetical protein Aglo01_41440 [Actinokineospora globicatena]GLW85927.1 hypothetical protein Aglo02_35670 [Actinokineospora globicatena]
MAHLATICRTPGRTATFRNAGTTLTVTHADGDITMASATKTHQLTITYRRYTATALAVILGELHDMIPTQQKAAS